VTALCKDCGMDTTPSSNGQRGFRYKGRWEYYMVHNSVWAAAGMRDGFLCIGCLETRLGRELNRDDFPDMPINDPDSWDTLRLASARMRGPTSSLAKDASSGAAPK
jgi:hypothetical protein